MERRSSASANDAHNVGFLHDEEFLTVNLDLGAGPFAKQHLVAIFDIKRDQLAALVAGTGANCNDLPLLWFLLGGVGDDDTTFGLLFAFEAADNDAVVQGTELHLLTSLIVNRCN